MPSWKDEDNQDYSEPKAIYYKRKKDKRGIPAVEITENIVIDLKP